MALGGIGKDVAQDSVTRFRKETVAARIIHDILHAVGIKKYLPSGAL